MSITIGYFVISASTDCSDNTCATFKQYNYPISKEIKYFHDTPKNLTLVAAGMRRKNLVLLEVNVYTVGIYMSHERDEMILADVRSGKPLIIDFSSDELENGTLDLAIVIDFVRGVSKSQVVDAMIEALSGPGEDYNQQLAKFKELLLNAIGEKGMKNGDELIFSFKSNLSEVSITVRGIETGIQKSEKS